MSYSIDDTNKKFIKITYVGTLSNEDIHGVLKEGLKTDGKELKSINRLEDMRKLRGIKIGFDDLMDLTVNVRTLQLSRIVKTAILTGNPLQYGMARMFQSILEHSQIEVKVFSNEEEACNWLSAID